jgi:hypothetical protein
MWGRRRPGEGERRGEREIRMEALEASCCALGRLGAYIISQNGRFGS